MSKITNDGLTWSGTDCFIVVPTWQQWASKALRVHPVQAMNAAQRQMAADLWTKPISLSHKPACSLLVSCTHHRQLKADTHFTIPRRVEGWVDLGGWPHTEMVYPLAHGHLSKY